MNPQIQNLDVECALFGKEIAEIDKMTEKIINAALAVLETQGLYAMFLYLKAREKDVFGKFSDKSMSFLNTVETRSSSSNDDILQRVAQISNDLDQLLFVRSLFIQALSYARYHLKAKG